MSSQNILFLCRLSRLVLFGLLCAAAPSCSRHAAPPAPPPHPVEAQLPVLPKKPPAPKVLAPIAFPDLDTGQINSVQFSPDGRRLAFGYGADAEVTMWNLETGRLAWQRHVDGADGGPVTFDPNRRFLVVQGYDPDSVVPIGICSLSGRLRHTLIGYTYGGSVQIENSGRFLVTSGTRWSRRKDGQWAEAPLTEVWNTRTWRRVDFAPKMLTTPVLLTASGHIREREKHRANAQPVYNDEATVRHGQYAATVGGNHSDQGFVEAQDVNTKKKLWAVTVKNDCPLTAAISPDGKTLATGSINGVVEFRDLLTGKLIARTHCSDGLIRCLIYSPNGRVLAAAGGEPTWGGGIRLLDTKSHTLLAVLKAAFPEDSYTEKDWTLDHPDWFAVLPDLSYLASDSVRKKIRLPGRKQDRKVMERFERPRRVRAALRRCYW